MLALQSLSLSESGLAGCECLRTVGPLLRMARSALTEGSRVNPRMGCPSPQRCQGMLNIQTRRRWALVSRSQAGCGPCSCALESEDPSEDGSPSEYKLFCRRRQDADVERIRCTVGVFAMIAPAEALDCGGGRRRLPSPVGGKPATRVVFRHE